MAPHDHPCLDGARDTEEYKLSEYPEKCVSLSKKIHLALARREKNYFLRAGNALMILLTIWQSFNWTRISPYLNLVKLVDPDQFKMILK